MKGYPVSLRILACLVIICGTFVLSCRRKAPTQPDINRLAPGANETAVKLDVNLVAPAPAAEAGVEPNAVTEAEPNAVTEAEPNAVTEAEPNSVAVIVNGVKITEGDIDKMLEPQLASMARQAQNRPPEFMEQMQKMLRQQALERMIIEQLLDEKVKEANIVITEEEVISRIREIASMQRLPVSLEDFKKKVEGLGQSFDEVKQQIQKGLGYQKVMEAQLAEKVHVTIEDANQYYKENLRRFEEVPEQVRASHILIKPEAADPNADPNEAKAKAKAKAGDLLKQIKEGADFAELAKANSDCPSGANGGDLGFFPKTGRGSMVPEFSDVAFALDVNELSDIVETQHGYHIIKVTDHKAASVTAFEQVKDDIIKRLTQNKQRELAGQHIKSLKAEANIVYPAGKEPKMMMPPVRLAPPPRQEKPVEPRPSEGQDEPAVEE